MIKFNFLKLIVDIGNSRTKLALFDEKHLVKHEITSNFSKDSLSNFCDNYLVNSSIFSSVRILSKADHRLISSYNGLLLDSKTPLPIQSNYKSTIGTDRISAVVGACYLFPNKNIWVFDAGTCLTADYIDKVLTRITFWGAMYVASVCLLPEIFRMFYPSMPFNFGGTSLLILVVVTMDFMSQLQAHAMSHQYDGMMKKANLRNYRR